MDQVIEPARTPADQPTGERSLAPLLKRFLRGAIWSVIASLAARGLPVIGSLIVARLLGRDGYGQLGIVQNTLSLFAVLSGLGLGLSATRFVASNRSTNPALAAIYAHLAMRITVGAGGLLALATFFLAPLLARAAFGDAGLTVPLQLAAPVVIFSAINSAQMGVLTGLEAYRSLALAGVAQGALTAALLIGGGTVWGVTGAVVALAVAEALSAGVLRLAVQSARRTAGLPTQVHPERPHWTTLLRFSIPALVSSSLTLPAALIGTILLTRQPAGVAEVGLFSAASRWSFAVLFIPTAVSRIVLPMLANLDGLGNRADFRRIFLANVATSSVAVAVPALTLIALANPVMALLGAEYRVGGSVLVVLLIATLPITLNEVIGQVLVSTGAIVWRLAFDIALALLLIALSFLLIPRWEAVGLAASQAIAYGLVSLGLAVVVALRLRGAGPVAGPGGSLRFPSLNALRGPVRARVDRPGARRRIDRGVMGCLIVAWVTVLWFCLSMPEPRYVAAIVPAVGMPLVLAALPACRPTFRTPLCPHNWLLFVFALQGLILPLLINDQGAGLGSLPIPATTGSVNRAILLSFVAFVAYCLAFQWANRATGRDRTYADSPQPERRPPHLPLAILCAVLGGTGLLLAFGSPGGLIAYYLSPEQGALTPNTAPASLAGAASTFLRPFLGFAVVLAWSLWADRWAPAASRRSRVLITAGAALALVVIYASFSYNRGAFAAPLLALVAAYSLRVRRIPWRLIAVGGAAGLLLLLLWGLYRTSTYGSLSDIVTRPDARAAIGRDLSPVETLEVYGGSPQLTGYILDNQRFIPPEFLSGHSLIGSVLSSVPILGESVRDVSGHVLFNRLVYGVHPEFYDQVMPFQAELYVNFGVAAIIVAYVLLGLVIARLERGFHRSPNTVQAFTTQYAAVWLAFLIPGSLAATSQIYIYFFWPIYLYLALIFIGWRSERNTPRPATALTKGSPA